MILRVHQSTCNIKFIKSAHLKYEIYKPREVEHPKKKLVRKPLGSLSDVQPPSVYKSHILNGPINKLYIFGCHFILAILAESPNQNAAILN